MTKRYASRFGLVLSALLTLGTAGAATVGAVGCSSQASWKVGDDVDVEWKGTWWKGKILEDKGGGQYKIHYVGWAASWDEVVPASRVRARTAGAKEGTEKK
jgi:hypothetical protein